GLHTGTLGDHGEGLQGKIVRMVQHMACDLLQPATEAVIALQYQSTQFVGAFRQRLLIAHLYPPLVSSGLGFHDQPWDLMAVDTVFLAPGGTIRAMARLQQSSDM